VHFTQIDKQTKMFCRGLIPSVAGAGMNQTDGLAFHTNALEYLFGAHHGTGAAWQILGKGGRFYACLSPPYSTPPFKAPVAKPEVFTLIGQFR